MQGRANRSGPAGQKTEPNSRAVDPRAVEQLGSKLNRRDEYAPMYPGRGYSVQAPATSRTIHPSGSQGKR